MPKSADEIQKDKELIKQKGGPSKVAELLGFAHKGGAQRVQNWSVRGIPESIKAANPTFFTE